MKKVKNIWFNEIIDGEPGVILEILPCDLTERLQKLIKEKRRFAPANLKHV